MPRPAPSPRSPGSPRSPSSPRSPRSSDSPRSGFAAAEAHLRDHALTKPEATEHFPWGERAIKVKGKAQAPGASARAHILPGATQTRDRKRARSRSPREDAAEARATCERWPPRPGQRGPSGNAQRGDAGWVSSRDRFPGRVVERRWSSRWHRVWVAIRPSSDEGGDPDPRSQARVFALSREVCGRRGAAGGARQAGRGRRGAGRSA
jgi:hypothetical protein